MEPLCVGDRFVVTPSGRLFARTWEPQGNAFTRAPILLFHDSLGSVDLWRDFPATLAMTTQRRVIAYDRLGFGRSDARLAPLALDFIATEAQSSLSLLQKELGFSHFIACGHSVGGGMAVEAAAQSPQDCQSVITLGAQSFVEEKIRVGIRAAQADFAKPEVFARLVKYHGAKAQWVLEAWVSTWLSPDFAGWNLAATVARLRCPLLVIHGEDDEYGSPDQPQRLAQGRGTVALLPDAGHFPHRSHPRAVLDLIAPFLS